jgi:hypothetical protein
MITVRWRVLARWIAEPWTFWLFLFALVVTWSLAFLVGHTPELRARIIGVILQLLGLVTVAIGLRKMRKLFGRPSLAAWLRDWLSRFLLNFRKPEPITITPAPASASGGVGEPTVRISASPSSTLEERISLLERDVDLLWTSLDRLQKGFTENLRKLSGRTTHDVLTLKRVDQQLQSQLEEVAVGGLRLEVLGLTWLLIGLVLATLPQESISISNYLLDQIRLILKRS